MVRTQAPFRDGKGALQKGSCLDDIPQVHRRPSQVFQRLGDCRVIWTKRAFANGQGTKCGLSCFRQIAFEQKLKRQGVQYSGVGWVESVGSFLNLCGPSQGLAGLTVVTFALQRPADCLEGPRDADIITTRKGFLELQASFEHPSASAQRPRR